MRRALLGLAALCAAVLVAAAAGATGNLPGGTSIEADVVSPTDHALLPDAPFTATGTAAVGQGHQIANTTLIYVVDVSGSTATGTGGSACPRQNVYDPVANTTLDCELLAVRDLNAAAIATGTVAKIGFIAFAGTGSDSSTHITSAAALDLDPSTGPAATLIAPDLSNFTPTSTQAASALFPTGDNLDWVTQSAFVAAAPTATPAGWPARSAADGFTLFSTHDVGTATNYYAALQTLRDLLSSVTTPQTQVVFLSDGLPNETVTGGQLGTILGQLHPANTNVSINTFAVVGGGGTCGSASPTQFGSLEQIAVAFGKHCVGLSSPEQATTSVPAAIASQLTGATLKVDGVPIATTISPALPQAGPANVTLTSTAPQSLSPGDHLVCASASGRDAGGTGSSGDDCHTITIKAKPTVDLGGGDGPDGTAGTVAEGSAFTLGASVGGATSTAWSSSGGTGTCSFADPTAAGTTVTCTDDGIYTLTLTATDVLGQVTTAVEHLKVLNVAPAAALTLSAGPHPLGSPVTAHVDFVDPGADSWTCTIDWGDGTIDLPAPAVGHACDATHTPTSAGNLTVTATVRDDDSGVGSDAKSLFVDAPPSAHASPSSGVEGSSFPLTGTATDDVAVTSTHWAITGGTGTCSIADASALSTTATCTDDGPYTATLTAADGVNAPVSDSATLTVANVAPSVSATPLSGRIAVGAAVTASFPFTDPGTDTFTCSIAWGDGATDVGTIAAGTCTGTHAYASGGSYTALGSVTDDDLGTGHAALTVVVDRPPAVAAGANISGTEGSVLHLAGSVSDDFPGTTSHWTATPGAGVDAGATCVFANPADPQSTVQCNDDGAWTLTLTADDHLNAPVSSSLLITLGNAAPSISITAPLAGGSTPTVSFSAHVTDPGTNDTETCTIAWGDGAASITTVAASITGVCSATHTYATSLAGATISAKATDDDGGVSPPATVALTFNRPPSCSSVIAIPPTLWPPNGEMRFVLLFGGSDPDGDAVTTKITAITQDEALGIRGGGDDDDRDDHGKDKHASRPEPDAAIVYGPLFLLRAAREGKGDGRVYTVAYTLSDQRGGSCSGVVKVTVPHDQKHAAIQTPGVSVNSLG